MAGTIDYKYIHWLQIQKKMCCHWYWDVLWVSNEIFVERNSRNFRNNFCQKFSRISMYFRPHFHENFQLSLNIKNDFRYLSKILFHFASRRLTVWGPHSWLTKHSRGWGGDKMCFLENIFPCSNILGVPNYMTRRIAIYLNLLLKEVYLLGLYLGVWSEPYRLSRFMSSLFN